MDKIAEIIEEKLGYTNGWRIDDSKYTDHCVKLAKQIRRQILSELKEDIYAAETIEYPYAGGKCEYIRVIDLSNILDARLGGE